MATKEKFNLEGSTVFSCSLFHLNCSSCKFLLILSVISGKLFETWLAVKLGCPCLCYYFSNNNNKNKNLFPMMVKSPCNLGSDSAFTNSPFAR